MTNHLTLIIVTLGTLASGWIGAGLNTVLEQPHQAESLGALVWLVTPLLLVVVARLLRRASSPGRWTPRFRQAWRMYLVALLAFPVVTAITAGMAGAIGQVDASGLKWESLLPVVATGVGAGLIKNLFEEAVWRGWFTGEFDAKLTPDWVVYLGVGAIWGLWHVPYYLFFLPEEQMRFILDVPRPVFAALAVVVMMMWGVLFTEVYRTAKSIWPVVLLHAVEDATVNPLVIDGHLRIDPGAAWWASPVVGLLPATMYLLLGLGLRAYRLRSERSMTAPTTQAPAGDRRADVSV